MVGNAQKRGRQYEKRIANDLYDATPPAVKVYPCGFSGNGAIPQPDILISAQDGNYAVEMKKSKKDRFYIDGEDLLQLFECTNKNTEAVIMMKFSYMEPLIFKPFKPIKHESGETTVLPHDPTEHELAKHAVKNCPLVFRAHATNAGSLRFDKPTTDEWCSSTAGKSDEDCVVNKLKLSYRYQR
ncbi:Holliday junction resolvase [Haloarcula tailed virus 2]|uniref:Holliday junction resolvase n=1 Tax=Haloarcula tailed virus 2 TaxID=2877989 RepID=A0AAE8XZB2_9CAUD|nr:Holliday junction resolvase [Haloarcula tailed virus 2]UBF23191.1 Holliday junction resolvase [Haloarcula tailed virus 2]